MDPRQVGAANRVRVLSVISDVSLGNQPATIREIADLCGVHRSTAQRAVNYLVASGLVIRRHGHRSLVTAGTK
jgi:DNA-binding GntR family transcriptional regulator